MRFSVPVADLIVERLPATLLLVFLAISLAGGVGLVVGTVMAMCAGGWRDRLLTGLTLIFYALPSFWLALMLMVVFSIWLGWLPTSGYQTLGRKLTGIDFLLDRLRYLILPVLALSSYYVALYARLTRSAVLEAKRQDYVRTAIAKGLSSAQVTRRHILRNALIPVTTLMGMHIGGALGGAVVIETIFAWPGMGRLTYEAILSRDYVLLLGILLSSVVIVIAANALIDVLHRLLDPRISPQS